MTPTEFASFKYQHADPAGRSPARVRFAGISLVIALLLLAWTRFPLAVAGLLVPLIAWFSAPRQLHLGPRYLLCGNTIIYYANVKRMVLSSAQGRLRVDTLSGSSLVLESEKFPTNARKADKISKNKAAKFDKVSAKIIEKVRKANSNVELSGI